MIATASYEEKLMKKHIVVVLTGSSECSLRVG
jgi:hypothetical protein